MTDIIVALIVVLIVGTASYYIYRAKKNGNKCIGCPHGKTCTSKGCCSCGKETGADESGS